MKNFVAIIAMFVVLGAGCADTGSSSASGASSYQYDHSSVTDDSSSYDDSGSCCKVCSKGKACGDSCISRSYTCHRAPGCACDE